MKDFLTEAVKNEVKIQIQFMLKRYYAGELTWIEYKEQLGRIEGCKKALEEEADVKPALRSELEREVYPLMYFMNRLAVKGNTNN